jgi:hypothetical protein
MLEAASVRVAVAWPSCRGLMNARRPFFPAQPQWLLRRCSFYSTLLSRFAERDKPGSIQTVHRRGYTIIERVTAPERGDGILRTVIVLNYIRTGIKSELEPILWPLRGLREADRALGTCLKTPTAAVCGGTAATSRSMPRGWAHRNAPGDRGPATNCQGECWTKTPRPRTGCAPVLRRQLR